LYVVMALEYMEVAPHCTASVMLRDVGMAECYIVQYSEGAAVARGVDTQHL